MTLAKRVPVHGFTVDGPQSMDLDDAILLQKEPDGGYRVTVSVADVSSTIPKGAPADKVAYDIGFTRYFATGNSPMFPRRFSENLLSLLPERRRRVLVFDIRLTPDLDVAGFMPFRGIYESTIKLNHALVEEALDATEHPEHQLWSDYYLFAERLLEKRRKSGALAIYDLTKKLYLTEEGQVARLRKGHYVRPHVIIQEFMILANQAITEYAREKGIPILYRNHATHGDGSDMKEVIKELYGSFDTLTPEAVIELTQRLGRFAAAAKYEDVCRGHVGLNLSSYAHWTSPIRRYPDLVNHRQLIAWMKDEELPYNEDELRAMGDHFTAVSQGLKKEAKAKYILKTQQRLVGASSEDLLKLSPGHFSYFVEMLTAGKDKLTRARLTAIITRMREGNLALADAIRILFAASLEGLRWKRLKEEVMHMLCSLPADLRKIPALCFQILEWTPHMETRDAQSRTYISTFSLSKGEATHISDACGGDHKDLAEARAVASVLSKISGVPIDLSTITHGRNTTMEENPKTVLLELCQQHKMGRPIFKATQEGPPHAPIHKCVVSCTHPTTGETIATDEEIGVGKNLAERKGCRAMVELIEKTWGLRHRKKKRSQTLPTAAAVPPKPNVDWKHDPISALNTHAQKKGFAFPSYDGTQTTAPFTQICTLQFNGTAERFEGTGPTVKEAKRASAMKACEKVFGST